jgi:broad specificity phosphatase PhoE
MLFITPRLLAKPVVKIYSFQSSLQPLSRDRLKLLHLIRHAEGTHNVHSDYRNPAHIDARLTPLGRQQCAELQKQLIQQKLTVDCIVTSTLSRAIQTAQLSFHQQLSTNTVPLIACEEWRETVNYLCDTRRHLSELKADYPDVDFSAVNTQDDRIWDRYERMLGPHDTYTTHRESKDYNALALRAESAWRFLLDRQEKSIAVVSHSALFMHMFTKLEGVLCYGDVEVQERMQNKFENCEIRSVWIEAL